jgi:hypothetical protein
MCSGAIGLISTSPAWCPSTSRDPRCRSCNRPSSIKDASTCGTLLTWCSYCGYFRRAFPLCTSWDYFLRAPPSSTSCGYLLRLRAVIFREPLYVSSGLSLYAFK